MDEKELELYGKKGSIDTEYERSIIEYRPRVKYEPNRPVRVNFEPLVNVEDPEDEEEYFEPEETPAKQYNQFVQAFKELDELLQYVVTQ